jgi:hypothetical protein
MDLSHADLVLPGLDKLTLPTLLTQLAALPVRA